MAASATYEQHVFGLEIKDSQKYLNPLTKALKILEKSADAWDKFEARVQGGGLKRAMGQVNGLIGRFQDLEKAMERAANKSRILGAGGGIGHAAAGGGGGSVMNSHDARRKYEVWWESQLKRQEAGEARVAARKQKEFDRLALDQQKAMERADKQQSQAMKPFANMWLKIGQQMQKQQFEADQNKKGWLQQLLDVSKPHVAAGLSAVRVGLSAIVDVMRSGVEYGKQLVGTIVEAAKERGLLMTAYEVQLGSRGKAEHQLQKTLDIAQLTPASNLQVVDMTKKLMGAQFQGRRLDAARAAWADVQAFGGDRSARQVEFWMSRMASRGEASTAGISGIAKAGISERFIREEIAKMLGKSVGYKAGGPYTDKMDTAVRDAVSDRKVSSGQFEVAVERAILRTLKQTELGAYSKKKGVESLAGVLSNIEEAVPTFLMRLNIDEFAGIKELKRFLADLLSFFSLSTKEGQQLAKIVEELTNELLGGLKNITREDMALFFERAAEAARALVGVIGTVWEKIDELLHDTSGRDLGTFIGDLGKSLGQAFGEGLAAAMPVIIQSAAQAMPGAVGGVVKGVWKVGEGLGQSAYWAANRAANWIEDKAGGTALGKAAARKRARAEAGSSTPEAAPPLSPDQLMSLPSYDVGGEIPGPPGQPVPAIVHAGEYVLRRGQWRRGGSGQGAGGGNVFIDRLIVQCDESAMRASFDEWLLETIETEVQAGGTVDLEDSADGS